MTKTRSGPDEPDLNLKMPRAFCQGLTKTRSGLDVPDFGEDMKLECPGRIVLAIKSNKKVFRSL